MKDKLSREEILSELEDYEYSMRDDGDEKFAKVLEEVQILIKFLFTPIPEEKLDEFVGKWWEEHCGVGKFSYMSKLYLKSFLKEALESLRGGKEE